MSCCVGPLAAIAWAHLTLNPKALWPAPLQQARMRWHAKLLREGSPPLCWQSPEQLGHAPGRRLA